MGIAALVPCWHEEEPRGDCVPSWSGQLTPLEGDPDMGVFIIHIADARAWQFPPGWVLVSDEPLYLEDCEVWVLARA